MGYISLQLEFGDLGINNTINTRFIVELQF